ncbi:MAG: hypothetical protein LBF32_04300 [Streptococcaceae bacterium]|jgi:hypothetical protein|nr:hypothetical protein [Streptococcaceae bacterium]
MEEQKISPLGAVPAAVLIEALITYFNQFFINGNFCWQILMSITIGIVITILYKINITRYFGMNSGNETVNAVISGILLSRGSNYVFDLLKIFGKM